MIRMPWQPNSQIAGLQQQVADLETRADSSYTDSLVSALLRQARGQSANPALVSATSAMEACAGKIGLSFAACEISGPDAIVAALTPDLMMMVGRALIRRGELVLWIDTSTGNLQLLPVMSHNVSGNADPSSWRYEMTLPGPSGTQTAYAFADGVIHLRYSADPEHPWRGTGPLQVAYLAGQLSAETVAALTDESAGPRGSFLSLPKDGSDDTIGLLKNDIAAASGKMLTVESTTDDWQAGGKGPSDDWEQKRFGPNPPAALVQVAELASREIYAACGLSTAIWGGATPAAAREAWRLALFSVIAPLGRLVETELRQKLDPAVRLGWDELRASDLSGRARSFQSMVNGGMDVSKAAALAGLIVADE